MRQSTFDKKSPPRRHYVLAALIALLGLPMTTGGAILITAGGSWYYLLSGLGLTASATLLLMRNRMGVHVFVATWLATAAWSLWEVGLDWWALMPRLLVLTLLGICLLYTSRARPVLRSMGGMKNG